jgi:hypothetical protein
MPKSPPNDDEGKSQWPSDAEIFQVAWNARDGTATPDDAKRLLEYFCYCFDNEKPLPFYLLYHLKDAFSSYLRGDKLLEAALGLKRKRGRPNDSEARDSETAKAVLYFYLEGMSVEEAVLRVEQTKFRDDRRVWAAWGRYKQTALELVREDKVAQKNKPDEQTWTPEDKERLIKIFHKEPWFTNSNEFRNLGSVRGPWKPETPN